MRTNRTDDCEYSDNQGRTRTQVLEETLERLQIRLAELENPDVSRPVLLADPYEGGRLAGSSELARIHRTITADWWNLEEPPTQIRDMLYVLSMSRISSTMT